RESVGALALRLEIEPGTEGSAGAGQDHHPHRVVLVGPHQRLGELAQHRPGDGVHALRSVQRHGRDRPVDTVQQLVRQDLRCGLSRQLAHVSSLRDLPVWWRRSTQDAMQNRFIDLYSDTKTKPSPGMRKAMAEAEVGDEQKYEDPTVERLRERICEILGKEDAVFMPSGTMCNQAAIRVHCRLGDEVIADRTAHIINAETGGTAANSGVMIRMLDGPNGVFTAEQVKAALRDPNSRNAPRSRLVSVENTSNGGFGTVWPLATLQGVSKVAHEAGLAVHMDGARLCNAAVKSGTKARDYAACTDSLWLDYTKGLGAPVGASLAGSKDFLNEAWSQKQMLGGSVRQSGVIAAAALYALEHNWDRLAEDHDNAHHLAAGIANIKGLECEVDRMQTNLVFFDIKKPGMTGAQFVAACNERGVGMGTSAGSATRIRAVTHLDVNRADIDAALKVINDVMAA